MNSVAFPTSMSQHENIGVVEKGDTKIGRGSSDSIGTNNSVYSDAVEVRIAIFFIKFEKKTFLIDINFYSDQRIL